MTEESAVPSPRTPTAFFDAVLGYERTAAIRAAIELGPFEAIGSARADAETIAARAGASAMLNIGRDISARVGDPRNELHRRQPIALPEQAQLVLLAGAALETLPRDQPQFLIDQSLPQIA